MIGLRNTTVKILDLHSDQSLKVVSTQNMKEQIESVVVTEMHFGTDTDLETYGRKMYIYTGLANGMLIRTTIDKVTGNMIDSRPKYLGSKPVKCVKLLILGKPAILALSSRPWLIYSYGNKQMVSLLAFPYLDIATQITIPDSPHAIIGFIDNMMKIISMESFGQLFHSDKISLKYSGKKLLHFKDYMGILESDRQPIEIESMNESDLDYQWNSRISIYDPKN